jgi:hypothetical protein
MGPSITFIKLKDGPCVGGLTLQSWSKIDGSRKDKEAKIFNLTTGKVFNCKYSEFAISNCSQRGPWFGVGELTVNSEPFNLMQSGRSYSN